MYGCDLRLWNETGLGAKTNSIDDPPELQAWSLSRLLIRPCRRSNVSTVGRFCSAVPISPSSPRILASLVYMMTIDNGRCFFLSGDSCLAILGLGIGSNILSVGAAMACKDRSKAVT